MGLLTRQGRAVSLCLYRRKPLFEPLGIDLRKERPMHAETRTSWVSWIVLLGYVSLCGLLWVTC
jgi:hypothetical protein